MLLYAVTDRTWVGKQTLLEQVTDCLKGGATCVQLREKELDKESFLQEAIEMQALCRQYHVPFIVNDNGDIAIAAKQTVSTSVRKLWQLPVSVRRSARYDSGVSARTVEQALLAEKNGADYLGVVQYFPLLQSWMRVRNL
jgi:thiamine-phosphate pyrophosphorylase